MDTQSERGATAVEIFGSVYHLKEGAGDPEHLQEMARKVDQTMREIARSVSTNDPSRIAILAGLNLASELFQCRKQHEGERVEIQEKVTQVTERLAEALEADVT